ncbi:hypothetical protein [Niabella sp.]|uniref:hypothetical protein n=1 Tax=Niabella sp. TaxID=1962976 RepID=UPI002629C3E2|nr:hypothetical protein [Niabella sp.]
MKRQLLLLFLTTGTTALLTAQTTISNSDGSYSLFYYSPYGSTIIYPDGSHARWIDYDSTSSILVYADFSFSRFFYSGSTTTIVHSDWSYSILHNDEPVPAPDTLPPYDTAFSDKSAGSVKNTTGDSYILLSDDSIVKPDPREAQYILLNNLIDSTTMRSRPLVPEEQSPVPAENQAPPNKPAPLPAGNKQEEPAIKHGHL